MRDTAVAVAGAAFGLKATFTVAAGNPKQADTSKILSYNPDMEYRRCGKTNMMVSAVCLGGHWKRIEKFVGRGKETFDKNRADVVTRCIERGINYIDACTGGEVVAYAKALKGRRDKMYLGYSWYEKESRNAAWRSAERLKQSFDEGLKAMGVDYVDLWRIVLHEGSGRHTKEEIDSAVQALEWAKKSGRARFTGVSSHDRPHIKVMIETFPQLEVICTPYTAKTKVVEDESGLWAAIKKADVGWFGIKPFASNSVFKGDSTPDNPNADADNRIARLAIRYILCNPAITAPIPGLIAPQQVDNVALAVKERRELDKEEKADLDRAMDRAWANLPPQYQFLRNWEYV